MGKVSIIVPVYNASQCLTTAVESAMSQTYRDLEIILVDDGSTDNSGELCDWFTTWDARIRTAHQNNGGPGAARNTGLQMCTGQWVLFLDTDDSLESRAVELLVEAAEQTGADLAVGDFTKIKGGVAEARNDIAIPSTRLFGQDGLMDAARLYLRKPNKHLLFAYSWGRLFKASLIREHHLAFASGLRTYEDVAFNFHYLCHAQKALFLKKPLYCHTVCQTFSSATMAMDGGPEQLFGFSQALAAIADFLKDKLTGQEIERETGHARTTLTIIQLVRMCGQFGQDNKKPVARFLKQLVADPQTRRALKFYAPAKGESRAVPLLIKLKLVRPIIWLCRYKAYKRYRKL
jgi:glycosyltransferase involved in cell wall biosynthesis